MRGVGGRVRSAADDGGWPTEGEATMDGTKKLGFGLMRLPKAGEAIDVEQTKRMVDLFLEAGFTYFDTAWAYPGSEEAIRKALVERHPRESYTLATKNAAWLGCKSAAEAKSQLTTSLERSGAGYIDYYLLHNLGESRTKVFDDFGLWDWAQEQKAAGLVRHVGFSFHSTAEELEAILRAHPEAEFVQLQINYADWDSPSIQSRRCWEVARAHGKPMVVMEPVKGGMLATPPAEVRELFQKAEPGASAASWAIRFAADLDGVMAVLSGMSSVAQMEDNLSFMKDFRGLDEEQRRTLAAAREALRRYPVVPCTSCDYCAKVCPKGIGISGSFTAMNCLTLYGNQEMAASQEGWLVGMHGKKRAVECVGCGACEKVCPQHIAIREELKKVAHAFGQ